jgi:hypothetical protein
MSYKINEIVYSGFEYPEAYEKLLELKLFDFDIWYLMPEEQAQRRLLGLQERYPGRKLVPFARRDDNDDIACFEVGKENRVQIIHDFASLGFEQRAELQDLWEWVQNAVKEMVEYNR